MEDDAQIDSGGRIVPRADGVGGYCACSHRHHVIVERRYPWRWWQYLRWKFPGGVVVVVDAAASIVILFTRIIFILTNALSLSLSLYSVLQEVMSDEHGVDPTGTYHGTTEIEYCICTNVPLFCVSSLLALNAF